MTRVDALPRWHSPRLQFRPGWAALAGSQAAAPGVDQPCPSPARCVGEVDLWVLLVPTRSPQDRGDHRAHAEESRRAPPLLFKVARPLMPHARIPVRSVDTLL